MRCGQLAAVVLLCSQQSPGWQDSSPHTVQFVRVDKDVRLEVLDWGGSGRPIVLLAGGGDTAHVFDDIAPGIIAYGHVYGITRRGFGASGYSASENAADRMGDDVLAVLDELKLSRVVLVGHSFAGEELSWVAVRHPNRVAGLIYLEAMYPYAFDNGQGPAMKEFLDMSGPQPPPPDKSELASFRALREYYSRVLGFTFPEAELRHRWNSTADGRVTEERSPPGTAALMAVLDSGKKYTDIPVAALAVFADPHGQGTWVDNSADPKVSEAAKVYSSALAVLTGRQAKAFAAGVPTARMVNIRGAHHYVYLSNEAEVLREIRAFLGGLR